MSTRQGFFMSQARLAIKQGDRRAAQHWLHQALRLDPANYHAWLWLAGVTPSPRASLSYVQRAQALNPGAPLVAQARRWAEARLEEASRPRLQPERQPGWGRLLFAGMAAVALLLALAWYLPRQVRAAAPQPAPVLASAPPAARAQSVTGAQPAASLEIPPLPAEAEAALGMTAEELYQAALVEQTAANFDRALAEVDPALVPAPLLAPPGLPQSRAQVELPPLLPGFGPKPVVPGSSGEGENGAIWARWTPTPAPTPVPLPTATPPALPPTATPAPDNAGSTIALEGGEHWIDVNLSTQTLTAYQGNSAVFFTAISSGLAQYPTVTGQFRIYLTYESQDMSGYPYGYNYYLPNVPYVMYFYQGYALHGTYWHNNFGTPMSHGCVNLRTDDAAWVWQFAGIGTLVNIHY